MTKIIIVGTDPNFFREGLLETFVESFTLNIFDQNHINQPLDLDINKNVIKYGDIKCIFDIYTSSSNVILHRKCCMHEETKQNSVDGILLETLLRIYSKNIFDLKQKNQPLDSNINKNFCKYGAIIGDFDIYMQSLNLNLIRKYSINRETPMNLVNNYGLMSNRSAIKIEYTITNKLITNALIGVCLVCVNSTLQRTHTTLI